MKVGLRWLGQRRGWLFGFDVEPHWSMRVRYRRWVRVCDGAVVWVGLSYAVASLPADGCS